MNKMKEYAAMRKAQLKEQVAQMEFPPSLLIIQVGNNEASNRYVRNKMKDCEEVGIFVQHCICPENITTEELVDIIHDQEWYYSSIIVQQPLPTHIDQDVINVAINPNQDVDGFHPMSSFNPATAKGIIDYLEWRNFALDGAHVVVIGRSDIVGKPVARMLMERNATVSMIHSHTSDIVFNRLIKDAHLIICAVGKALFLDCRGLLASVVDVGINFDENGKMCGDCIGNANTSPVPGGVGLLTRVALLENVMEAANA